MLKKLRLSMLSLILCLGASPISLADDIDIYYAEASAATGLPMVMFSLDYRPNLGSRVCQGEECQFLVTEGYLPEQDSYTFFELLRAVLKKVMEPLEDVRVGLMLNHDNRNNCAGPSGAREKCANGGYIAMGFEEFTAVPDDPAKKKFHDILASIPIPSGSQSHSFQGKELFFEFYRYLTGQGIYNGHNGYTDYYSDPLLNLDDELAVNPSAGPAWDATIENGPRTHYISPLRKAGECTRIFTINPLFFVANQEADSDAEIEKPIAEGGTGAERREFVHMIDFLSDIDLADGTIGTAPAVIGRQSVTSYFIVDPTKINRTTIGYAQAGNTGQPLPLTDNPEELIRVLRDVFKQILSVSTTFVAASVPVNVFNRSEVLDNVYLALFQADEEARPYWVGNLKKLRLEGLDIPGANVQLVDARGQPAVAGDGRLSFEALTYWTNPDTLAPPDIRAGEVAGRDGRSVDRGGAGQPLRMLNPGTSNADGGRKVYFDHEGALAPLDVSDAVISILQNDFVESPADLSIVSEYVAYSRGLDIDDLDSDSTLLESRRWIMADPLHSRPLPVNYGAIGGHSRSNPAIYLAVASNDGYMHFFRNTDSSGGESGAEVWAFMPRRTMDVIPVLRNNVPGIRHPYTVDGAPAVYMEDRDQDGNIESADGDRVYMFFGLRRGGRSYYALDITDPENPELLWSINGDPDRGVIDPDFTELGHSFSIPRVGMIPGASGGDPVPVVIFSGGYDFNKDRRDGVGTNDSMGNSLFVVNAVTGQLIWKATGTGTSGSRQFVHAGLVDSIPSTPAAADMDGDGYLDRIVVGDSGGNVWRADIKGSDPANWKLALLARLGRHADAGITNDRRFFHRPDLVLSRDEYGAYDAVVLTSGNRADPLDKGGIVDNWVYVIKDRQILAGPSTDQDLVHGDLADVTSNCLQGGTCSLNLSKGWRMELVESGEKGLATPITVGGNIYITSYIPRGASVAYECSPSEGTGRLYSLRLDNGFAVRNNDSTDDDPSNPGIPTSHSDRYEDLSSAGIPAEVVSIPPNRILRPDLAIQEVDVSTRWRTYWFHDEDEDNP